MTPTAEQTRVRQSRAELVAALEAAGARSRGTTNALACPFHDDKTPSASVFRGEDGAWRFRCHVCDWSGDVFDVRARVTGRPLEDVLREASGDGAPLQTAPQPQKPARVFPTVESLRASFPSCEAVYQYAHPDTRAVELVVLRVRREAGGKDFFQASPAPGGAGFVLKKPKGLQPLYNRARLRGAAEVIVVEGEKCVHALHDIGLVATTAPGGANAPAAYADWSPLAGKTVYLWPDNDPVGERTGKSAGLEHMKDVARELEALNPAPAVRMVDVAALGLPDKGDVVEYLAMQEGGREEKLIAAQLALEDSVPLGAAKGLERRIGQMISGEWRTLEWPWGQLTRQAKALMPATITVIAGDPGSSKSFLLLEAMWGWHMMGLPVALYELEEDRDYHMLRALAQIAENSNFTDDDWVRNNPDDIREAFAAMLPLLESFARQITDAPDKLVTLAELEAWVETKFRAGCQIVGIDPVTAAATSDKPWADDQKFILNTKKLARDYGGRLVLVTHPRKDRGKAKGTSMDDMAGGAAYQRFSQCVLWLKRHEQRKKLTVATRMGTDRILVNRSVLVKKARNGPGAGVEIAFDFDGGNLRFVERGVVVADEAMVEA
jgi:hypothetical protein